MKTINVVTEIILHNVEFQINRSLEVSFDFLENDIDHSIGKLFVQNDGLQVTRWIPFYILKISSNTCSSNPYDLLGEILSNNKVEQSWYVTRQFQTRTGFCRLNDDLSCDFKSIISVGRSGLSEEINISRLKDFGIFVKSIGAFYWILDTSSWVTPPRIVKKF